ncbi:uncharacterized protein VTP21DRAFT_8528 [Calcarisporiella thermophila]|uniref:uncharacterized protein n=1 Tax=Calcarisporiella thermophila TaxID=911321 RepID=UPI00374208C0
MSVRKIPRTCSYTLPPLATLLWFELWLSTHVADCVPNKYSPFRRQNDTEAEDDEYLGDDTCVDDPDVIYCSPPPAEEWQNGTSYTLEWNNRNPELAPAVKVDFYLLFQENGVDVEILSFKGVPNDGALDVRVNGSWYPKSKPPGPVARKLSYAWQVARHKEPRGSLLKGPTFFILQRAELPRTSVVTTSIESMTTMLVHSQIHVTVTPKVASAVLPFEDSHSSGIQPWLVGVISAGCVCIVFAVIAVFFVWRRHVRQHQLRRRSSVASFASLTAGEPYRPSLQAPALILARPESFDQTQFGHWAHPEMDEESRRRRGEELMRRELEDEGRYIRGVSHKVTEVSNIDDIGRFYQVGEPGSSSS